MTERKISATQLALLLFLSSLAPLLASGAALTEALAYPLAMALAWLALVPAFLLQRRRGLLSSMSHAGKPLIIPGAALLTAFCVVMAARALGSFSFFLTSTVYPNAQAGIFLIGTALVCAYAAAIGLEPLARLGLWAALLALVTVAALTAGLSPLLRSVHFTNPTGDGIAPILRTAGQTACAAGELVLFPLLLPRARGNRAGPTAAGWLLLTTAAAVTLALLVTAALGPFAASRRFPVHTAAAVAHFSPQGRMDLLFLFLYVLATFTRVSLWLYGGCLCLRRLFPRLRRGGCAVFCAAAAALLGFFPFTYDVAQLLLSGWTLLFAFAVPLLLLPFQRKGDPA